MGLFRIKIYLYLSMTFIYLKYKVIILYKPGTSAILKSEITWVLQVWMRITVLLLLSKFEARRLGILLNSKFWLIVGFCLEISKLNYDKP